MILKDGIYQVLVSGLTQFDGRVNLRRAILLGSKGILIGVLNSIFYRSENADLYFSKC
jgi:hypothetical protein